MKATKIFLRAYSWNMLGNLIVRSMGLLSTLVLVRVLNPEDFGIIAMALMIVGYFNVMADMGVNRYLILLPNPMKSDYDSAWTLNIVLRLAVLIVVLFFTSQYAHLLNFVGLSTVLYIAAITSFIQVFQSIKLIEYERAMNYAVINKIHIITKVFAVIATLLSALYFESYFALLIGNAVSALAIIILSYVFTRYRPAINFRFKKSMFKFSSYIILRNIVGYSRSQIDTLIVGKKFGSIELGEFNISKQFAILPQTEIINPAIQPAFPLLSSLKDNRELFLHKIFQTLFLIYSFIIPCCIGLFVLSEPFVLTVLGDKWSNTIPFIGYLGFLMIPFSTQMILHTLYDSLNKTKYSMLTDLFGLTAIFAAVFSINFESVNDFVEVRVVIGLVSFFLSLLLAKVFTGIGLIKMLSVLVIPVLCSLFMFMSFKFFLFSGPYNWLTLVINVVYGATLYIVVFYMILKLIWKFNDKSWLLNLLPGPIWSAVSKNHTI